ncbi:hypothetical protein ACFFQF_15180 [Haladaptatus pallidirubidus]|uniref:Uncharacterized protein n=1 Tax=Haladaptatus pallidirubidus TaxID=1008152 RepID=A0AAV3UCL6_9EURY|nr:hypothetical protein [Haladaptatus pallidirubidus]
MSNRDRTEAATNRDRGVSVTVNYALNLVVATLLIAGLLTATGGMVEDQRRDAVRTELQVIGQRLSADVQTADRLVQTGGTTVAIESSLPERVAGVPYSVTVEPGVFVLETSRPRVTVRVSFVTTTTVEETAISGGSMTIVRADSGELEVRS